MPFDAVAALRTLPELFTLDVARTRLSKRALYELLDLGLVERVTHGTYRKRLDVSGTDAWRRITERHLALAQQQATRLQAYAVSHTTGGVVHELSLPISDQSPVEMTVIDCAPRTRRSGMVIVHHSDSIENTTEVVGGLRVTPFARTTADVLRTRSLPTGVALLDEVARSRPEKLPDIRAELDEQVRWPGRPKALGALQVVDPRRETWLESYSFASLHVRGVPFPVPQVEIFDEDGVFVARVDGLDAQTGTFFEADGLGKYFLDALGEPDEIEATVRRNLQSERWRHDRLVDLGLTGVRWMSHEIRSDPDTVVSRVNAARAAGQPAKFRGWVGWEGELHRLPLDIPTPELDLERLRYRRDRRRRE